MNMTEAELWNRVLRLWTFNATMSAFLWQVYMLPPLGVDSPPVVISGGENKSLRKKFWFQSSTVKQDDESETWGSPAPQLFDIVLGLSSCLRTARTSPHRLWRYVVMGLNCSYSVWMHFILYNICYSFIISFVDSSIKNNSSCWCCWPVSQCTNLCSLLLFTWICKIACFCFRVIRLCSN